jgi:hypothetical protein
LSEGEISYVLERLDGYVRYPTSSNGDGVNPGMPGMSKYNTSRPFNPDFKTSTESRPRIDIVTNNDYYVRPVTVVTNTTTTNTVTFTTTTTTTTDSFGRRLRSDVADQDLASRLTSKVADIKHAGNNITEAMVLELAVLLAEA